MKNQTKFFVLAIVMLSVTVSTFAQATSTAAATSTATIVTPILITKNVDMNFGNIATNLLGGTVTLPATAAANRSFTGNITLTSVAGTVSAAKFTVTGEDTYTYSTTLPVGNLTITRVSGSETMIVNGWSTSATGTIGATSSGTEEIYVGATITVAGNQVPGVYVSGTPFNVTVNYN